MTDDDLQRDLPRRAYPLVVPPPGGFENAVHRGRRLRRHRTGSGSALALVVVGALAYSMIGHGGGTNSLHQIEQPPLDQQRLVPAPSASADTRQAGTDSGMAGPQHAPVAGQSRVNPVASATPPPFDVPPPVGHPSTRPFAPRQAIGPAQDLGPNKDAGCLGLSTNTGNWCATANATPETDSTYTLTYTLCRNVNAGSTTLTFDRTLQVDFVAKDMGHDDTVWTYSAGVPVDHAYETVSFQAGYCKSWSVVWNGYDDYGDNPAAGKYQIFARSTALDSNVPSDVGDFNHG